MNYINLHTHTWYSPLDGLNSPAEYMERAKELGMSHLAITDHGTLAGHREFQKAAKEAGVVPILGMEGYISSTDRFDKRSQKSRTDGTSVYNHITLLSQHEIGQRTLNRLSQTAYEEGYYFKPRIDTELLFSDHEGIIVLSGCMSGLIAKSLINGDEDGARVIARQYKDALKDDFYIEVMSSNDPELNHGLLKIADDFGIKPVMTTDCHYAKKEDLWLEEAFLILSTNPKPNHAADFSKSQKMDMLDRFNYLYPDRRMSFQEIEVYLRDFETEKEAFLRQGITRDDIYENTYEIASRVGDYPFYQGLDLLPNPEKHNPDNVLRSRVMRGLDKLGLGEKEEYLARAEEELEIIKNKEFSTYFLIVEDAITWSRNAGIPVGPGRGSAAGSLVCYALGITSVDPIHYGLLFFRFIDGGSAEWEHPGFNFIE